ncbi:glycosyltransferase [Streptosporangium carneum]|uniref:Glycosyltransferase 2-like domain-containing protein n=1 Tax=Streptosporangium carneum TaxID=47481 RepID=A0A9W6I6L3_9ACTN|nr:glycosyltransferase [Streptosporangium carneum]GLK11900.1 hypothetical protein GCM10017600_53080 [Streptosporangium carneum]
MSPRRERPVNPRRDSAPRRHADGGPEAAPPALGCHIGFEASPTSPAGLCEGIEVTWADLDALPADHLIATEEQESFLLLARTPADLRRAVPYSDMLPRSRALTVIVAESPPWRPAPVPAVDGAAFWRTLRDVRVRRGGERRARDSARAPAPAWRIDVTFGRAVPAGDVLRAVARGMGGLSRETLLAPVVSLSGVGAGQWRPGDPNVTLAPVSGPVPARRDAPGCDLSLRSLPLPRAGADTVRTASPDAPVPQGGADTVRTASPDAPAWQPGGPPPIDRLEPGLTPDRLATAPSGPGRLTPPGPFSDRLVAGRPRSAPLAPGSRASDEPFEPLPGHLTPGHLTPDHLAPIDERSICPIGFLPEADGPVGELVERSGAYEVVVADGDVVRVPLSGSLTDADVARMRGLTGVAVDLTAGWSAPLGVARAVCGLAAAGVPVLAEPAAAWRDLLGGELAALLDGFTAERLSDALDREQHSVRLRRCALALHGVAGRWRGLAAAGGVRPRAPRTVSVLLCTRRPDMVAFALEQAGRQRGPEVEVLLTLHGFPADHPDVASAVSAYKGTITVIEADSRLVFGDALNQAAERARGAYLTKMDDDDWYGPEHLSDLLLAHHYSSADLVGSAPEFVYLERIGVTVRRVLTTETYTGVVAGGTMLMSRAAFDDVGGFRPIPRTVDGQLLQSVSAAGGRIYRTHGLNYILRRREASGHTWQEPINAFLRSFRRQWRGLHANPLMEMEGLSATGETGEHDEA